MIEDITTVIKAQLYDRIASPLTGAFLFSWPIWNWKFIVILFSDLKAPEKLIFISNIIFPDLDRTICYGVLFPLASAVILITVYPFPSRLLFWISQYHKKSMKLIQQSSEDENPMTREEAAHLRNSFIEIQLKREKEIRELVDTITDLKHNLTQSEQFLASTSERTKSIDDEAIEWRARISSLEIERNELLTTTRHLQAIISSVSQAINLSPGENAPNYQGPREVSNYIANENIRRVDIDLGVERAVKIAMDQQGLLLNYSPEIYALAGYIYLRTAKPTPRTYIVGSYNPIESKRAAIDSCLELLVVLNRVGFKA